jgi:DNA-binding CsgD family transcriptional regulator
MTPTEKLVYELILTGKSNAEIGAELGCTEKMVKFHATGIYKKNNVKSRSQLINKILTLKALESQATMLTTVQDTLADLAKLDLERRTLLQAQASAIKSNHKSKEEIEEAFRTTMVKMRIVPESATAVNMKAMLMGALGL